VAIFALFGGVFLEDDSVGRLLLLLDGENREPLSPCHNPQRPVQHAESRGIFLFLLSIFIYCKTPLLISLFHLQLIDGRYRNIF